MAKRRRPVEDDSGSIRHFLHKHIRERIEALDLHNRKGLEPREYRMNCGAIRELVRLEGEVETLIQRYNTQQENDDV